MPPLCGLHRKSLRRHLLRQPRFLCWCMAVSAMALAAGRSLTASGQFHGVLAKAAGVGLTTVVLLVLVGTHIKPVYGRNWLSGTASVLLGCVWGALALDLHGELKDAVVFADQLPVLNWQDRHTDAVASFLVHAGAWTVGTELVYQGMRQFLVSRWSRFAG